MQLKEELLGRLADLIGWVPQPTNHCIDQLLHLLVLRLDHDGLEGDEGRDHEHRVLTRALVVVLEPELDDVLEDELQTLRELDIRADAFMRRLADSGLHNDGL